jgi:selenocysteine lyase/cysteine desulfurase
MNKQKHLFLLDERIKYLNCANMSPMLASVKLAGLQALETRAAPWKLTEADWFDNAEILRQEAAKIFQTSHDNIALVPSASYGLAVAAKNCIPAPGKTIVVLHQEFPSNYYVWEELAARQGLQLVSVQQEAGKTLTESVLQKIDSRTGLVAIPNCHWTSGIWIDLQKISNAARAAGAFLVLDLSQSMGALPTEIDVIKPDFAVSVGYKWMLGPYGVSYMYVSPQWQQPGVPLEYSWLTKKGSDNFANLTNYVSDYRPAARKFDMGEFSQINLLPMAIAALQQINKWGTGFIQDGIKTLTDIIAAYKKDRNHFNELAPSVGHITHIPLDDMDITALKKRLQDAGVVISFRGKSMRVAPHLYNDAADIEAMLSCLEM